MKNKKPKDLGELTKQAEDFEIKERGIYVPNSDEILKILKENWYNTLHPKWDLFSVTSNLNGSPAYLLWNLSDKNHENFNQLIVYATDKLKELDPKSAEYLGIFHGLSEFMYGLKTRKGKHMISGLTGLSRHLKEVDDPKAKKLGKKAYDILNKHFSSEDALKKAA